MLLSRLSSLHLAVIIIYIQYISGLISISMMMMMEYDYYDCNQTTFCKIDCIDQECDNIIINGTKSTLFNIIGCEDNCDNMTIHCPISKPNQSQYECYIASNCSD